MGDAILRSRAKRPCWRPPGWNNSSIPDLNLPARPDMPEYIHNDKNSRLLLQFPAELFNKVVELVPATALLALRLTSRDLYRLCDRPVMIMEIDRYVFKTYMRRDALSWWCRWERHERTIHNNLSKLTCSSCKRQHGISQFSIKELETDPEFRLCLGVEHSVRLCKHTSFSFNTLRSATLKDVRSRFSPYPTTIWICKSEEKASQTSESPEICSPCQIVSFGWGGVSGPARVVEMIRLCRILQQDDVSVDGSSHPWLLSAIYDIKKAFCDSFDTSELPAVVPSSSSDTPDLRTALLTLRQTIYKASLGFDHTCFMGSCKSCTTIWLSCLRHPNHRDAAYSISRRPYDESLDDIILTIYHQKVERVGANARWAKTLGEQFAAEQVRRNEEWSTEWMRGVERDPPSTTFYCSHRDADWELEEVRPVTLDF